MLTLKTAQSGQRFFVMFLLLLGAVVFFYRLGDRDMSKRLEAEAGVAARDMLSTGRILIPHLSDQPFIDNRPPGAFWAVAASFKMTGRSDEWAARLPSALAALGCVLLVYAMGKRAADPTAGFLSALVLLGMLTFVILGRESQQDMPLTLWTTLATWAFWRSLDEGRSPWRYVLAFQLFLGLGALTKGPAVVITIVFPLAAYILYSRRWGDVKWPALVATLPVSLILALGWYLYIWVEWPSMREGLIGRFTTQSSLHVEGLFYYVLHLPHLLGPVILFLPLLVIGWFKTASAERRGPLGLFVIAAVTVFLVFCLFPSKRTHYLVSLLPPLALAFGLVVGRERYDEGRYLTRSTLVFAILFALLVLAWNVIGLRPLNLQGVVRAWTAFVLLAGLGAGSWVLLRAGRRGMAWRVSWVGVVMGMSFFIGDVYPRLRNPLSPRTFSEAVARVTPPQARLGSLSSHGALIYYLARPVEVIPLSSADAFLESPDHYLIVDDEDLPRIAEEHRQIVFAQSPYGHHDAAYLLRGGGLTGDSIKPVMCHNEQALAVLSWSSTLKDFWLRMVRAFMPIPPVKARPGVP